MGKLWQLTTVQSANIQTLPRPVIAAAVLLLAALASWTRGLQAGRVVKASVPVANSHGHDHSAERSRRHR